MIGTAGGGFDPPMVDNAPHKVGFEYEEDDDFVMDSVTEISWMPYYQWGEWTTFNDGKRRITMSLLLLSGVSHEKGRVAVTVEDDGLSLVIKCKVPDMMDQDGLGLLHSDEPSSVRDHDFHQRVRKLSECVKSQKERIGSKLITTVARIPLQFVCDEDFVMKNKADSHGARILYITLKELEVKQECNPEDDWPVLKEFPDVPKAD